MNFKTASGKHTPENPASGEMSLRDHWNTLILGQRAKIRWGCYKLRFQRRYPRLHALWSETGSFSHRILRIYRRGGRGHVYTGSLYRILHDGGLIPNTTTQGRTCCTKRLRYLYPSCSLEDLRIALFAWEMGREWGLSNLGVPGEEPCVDNQALENILNNYDGHCRPCLTSSSMPQI